MNASATISDDFFSWWWGSCCICLFNNSASIFGPACRGLPGCWRWEYLHGRVMVICIKSIFPIRSETPTMCFSASVTIFTIFAQEICFTCDLSFWVCVGHSCSVGGVCKDLWWIPNYWVCGDVYFRRVFLLWAHWLPCRVSCLFWILYDISGPFPMCGTFLSWCECFELE